MSVHLRKEAEAVSFKKGSFRDRFETQSATTKQMAPPYNLQHFL